MLRGPILLLSGLLLLLAVLAISAAADPDPPLIDGGNVTFDGDWTVDPGDRLVYVNQTFVLNGDLNVEATGTLDLVNCTIFLNGTGPSSSPRGGIHVKGGGSLNLTSGSLVRPYSFLPVFFFADPDAHLLVEDSTVENIGFTAPLEHSGLYSKANDTVIRGSTIVMGNRGLILDGVKGSVVQNSVFDGISRVGLYLIGGSSDLILDNLTFNSQMESIGIIDCHGIEISEVTIHGPTYGISMANASVTLRNARFREVLVDSVRYLGEGSIEWRVDGRAELLNSTLDLNGSLEVLSGGEVDIINSTLRIQNPLTNGTHGIEVLSGGTMRVALAAIVMAGPSGLRYHWTVSEGGLL
ncbi:MAG: right-handed parallel beta-helix repeat-containing protein, partial [Candidatus Thermoplasmatota archaeon]|nr:right-handed parallel beta-helix repeat-containing protein [Candidatus Thermoplasmatota archaeon]